MIAESASGHQMNYECYGVVFSAPFPLAGYRSTRAEATVRIEVGSIEGRVIGGAVGRKFWSASTDGALLHVPDVASYYVDRHRNITVELIQADLAPDHMIYGVPVAAALTMGGLSVLHGAGVVADGEAILFVGSNGVGKSSLASAFVKAGSTPISDNLAPIDTSGVRPEVRPGPSLVRLWGDMARRLEVDTMGAARVNDGIDKFIIGREVASEPAPLGTIIEVLPTTADVPTLDRLNRFEATAAVVTNHFRRGVAEAVSPGLMDRSAAIAALVPVYTLNRPASGYGPVELADFVASRLSVVLPGTVTRQPLPRRP